MADKKISQLTSATTPLAGTEVLPIVQSGSTVKVSSDDLTVKNVRSNATTGILQVAGPGAAATRTMTVPDANFTVARTDAGQTFTGTQVMTSPRIVTSINDTNGNELVNVTATASAVNEITVANAATGNRPTISTSGNDADIGLYIAPKGSGNVLIASSLGINATPVYKLDALSSSGAQNIFRAGQSGVSNGFTVSSDGTNLSYQFDTGNIKIGTSGKGIVDTNGNESMLFTATASAVNELTVANAATGSNPAISSTGGDTNIGLRLNTKGSGPLSINGPLNRFVASGTNSDTTVAATISFVSQSSDWISQLIEFRVALSSTAGSSVHGGVVRYILSSLDSGTGLATVTALASDLTGVTAATSVSGNNLTVTFTITGGGNCNRYGISAEVLSSNGAGWWASGMTVA